MRTRLQEFRNRKLKLLRKERTATLSCTDRGHATIGCPMRRRLALPFMTSDLILVLAGLQINTTQLLFPQQSPPSISAFRSQHTTTVQRTCIQLRVPRCLARQMTRVHTPRKPRRVRAQASQVVNESSITHETRTRMHALPSDTWVVSARNLALQCRQTAHLHQTRKNTRSTPHI